MLFKEFGVNYNNEFDVYKRGTILIRLIPIKTKGKMGKEG